MQHSKALVAYAARDLRIEEIEEAAPGPGEVKIEVLRGGICGSDLHYFNHGGFGNVRLQQPMILGHEVSGRVSELGEGVASLEIGQLVAVSPSRPCNACRFCHQGMQNHCLNMRFYGSAMPYPHIQGAFRQKLVANVTQCAPSDRLTASEAAVAEPLAVCLHAVRQAGEMLGKKVLVTGCGPIGMLTIMAARLAGATEIVATDLSDDTLDLAKAIGADTTINIRNEPDALTAFSENKGYFDVLFECTGVAQALAGGISVMLPRGVIVQLGLGGDMTIPVQAITAKELQLRGSFRFHQEFFTGVELMQKGLIDVRPLISHTLPIDQSIEAFELASDRSKAMKVQIAFD